MIFIVGFFIFYSTNTFAWKIAAISGGYRCTCLGSDGVYGSNNGTNDDYTFDIGGSTIDGLAPSDAEAIAGAMCMNVCTSHGGIAYFGSNGVYSMSKDDIQLRDQANALCTKK